MKQLTLALILLSICLLPGVTAAQDAGQWISVAPSDEPFRVEMPRKPSVKKQKSSYSQLDVSAQVYAATDGDATYTLWSLKNNSYKKAQTDDNEIYLDNCAELVWEVFLKPLREDDPEKRYVHEQMVYQGELKRSALAGREYSIRLKKASGLTRIYVSGERLYVLMVLSATGNETGAQRFFQSLTVGGKTVQAATGDTAQETKYNTGGGDAVGYGPGRAGNTGDPATATTAPVDYNKVFTTREVTQKARILYRPEPTYTESARKFAVQGTILLRAVFSKDGNVTNIKVVKRLPHGLTMGAIAAARAIRFTPAQKDGQPVSQYIQIEYNYHLY